MDGRPGGGPKFPGDLSDHLARREEPPDRWADRLRHAWFLYAILAVAIPSWAGAMVAAVVYLGPFGWLVATAILLTSLGVYARVLQWRLFTGRDIDTGERVDRRDR